MMKKKTDVLILGAGIGGYEAFRSLSKAFKRKGIKKRITIVDKNNYFTFTPMLHEVASGSVQPSHCAIPVRQCVYKTPHEFWQATVEHIDPESKCVKTDRGEISYEYCVVALGSKTNYFGTKGAKEFTEHVRSLPAAMSLHQRMIEALEDKMVNDIDIVIVGGGATGVELAGQFCHVACKDIKELYPEDKLKITVVQSGDCLMKYSDLKVQKAVTKKLKESGVNVMLNARVKEVTKDAVILGDNRKVKSTITAWTAGFANTGVDYLDEKYLKKGQVLVGDSLQSVKSEDLYALGDISFVDSGVDVPAYPKLGEIAHKQGQYIGKHIACRVKHGKGCKPFDYRLKGELVPIGDWWAVAHIGPFYFRGWFAWWLRRTVYLMFIPGFMRKLRIVMDWTLHAWGFRHIVNIDLGRGKDST